jgi:serine/threonine-protein kinase
MLSFTGEVKLIDFGIAKVIGDSSLTQARMVVGRPIFTAPETIAGGEADRRSDIYSLGVVLWMMLTGRYFPDIFEQGVAPAASSINRSVGDRLDSVCLRAIAVRPEDRYQSAEELLDALAGLPAVAAMYDRKVAAFLAKHFDVEEERRQLARDVAGAQEMLAAPTIVEAAPEAGQGGATPPAPAVAPTTVEAHPPKRALPLSIGLILGASAAALVAWSSWPAARPTVPPPPSCPPAIASAAAAAPAPEEKRVEPPVPSPEPAPLAESAPPARAERRPVRGLSRKPTAVPAPLSQPDAGELLRDATAQLKAGAFDRAFELASAAVQAGAGAPAHLIMGKVFFAKSDLPRAEAEFRKVAALRPNDAEAASFLEVIRKEGGHGP